MFVYLSVLLVWLKVRLPSTERIKHESMARKTFKDSDIDSYF